LTRRIVPFSSTAIVATGMHATRSSRKERLLALPRLRWPASTMTIYRLLFESNRVPREKHEGPVR
jgi:hypothetical protein